MGDINRFVKLKVPFVKSGTLISQTAFGTEELFMDARENVSQRFLALRTEDGQCPAIINNCLYGSHFENGALYLSLTRGVSYCAHPIMDRPIIPSDRYVKKIDQGENNFSFRLGVFAENQLENAAQLFNHKPYALNVFPTGGKQPPITASRLHLMPRTSALSRSRRQTIPRAPTSPVFSITAPTPSRPTLRCAVRPSR
jgi:alpha-mannosidase